jgi:hypothetical protein
VTDVTYTWRDSELQAKPLRALNSVGARLSRFGVVLPPLTPSSVVGSAIKMAGSSDLGSDSYREPLEVYLAACRDEAELTTFGRILISKMLAAALANRIALHQWSVEHPDVRSERIDSPWIIVGLPLLAAYPDARIVWTHRDPGPVITSLASLANAGQRPFTSRTDPRPTANEWKRKCAFGVWRSSSNTVRKTRSAGITTTPPISAGPTRT